MAVTPKSTLVSEVRVYDADSSGSVYVIVDAGTPDGAADPQASATKGSLYARTDATDDQSPLYVKVDESSASDDWVAVVADYDEAARTMEGTWTWATDNAVQFRDSGQKIYSSAANVGNINVGAAADAWRLGNAANSDYLAIGYTGEMTQSGSGRINLRTLYEFFDDFDRWGTWVEAETPYVLNKGSDGSAADPAIGSGENGIVTLTTGAGDGTTAQDGSGLVMRVPVQADSGELVLEARLHINTAITNVAVFVGFTDSTALEEPFTNAADVITSTASDGCGFLYDTDATTDEWWMVAVDSDTDDSGNATTGTAPTADTYQKFRIEVSSDGATILFYIDGTLEGTFSGDAGVSPDVNLYATVMACGDGSASKTVDVDYLYVSHTRP